MQCPSSITLLKLLPAFAGLLIGLLAADPAQAAEPRRPNIVLFIADDLSWSDCSIYGESGIATPNMERLARAGRTFTHAFIASPSCAPSRAALLTALNPVRNGAMFNHTLPDERHPRWPAYFRALGYETVAIGKVAHYATVRQYGFDHVSHFRYHEDDCIDAAIKWLERRTSDKPLCLLVGTNWPHVPWPRETPFAADDLPLPPTQVDTPETRQWRARYAAAVSWADRDLGLVYDAAYKHLGDNTLFLFTSDHGSQFPFGKWNCYDAGIRSPLVAVWPGKIEAAAKSEALVSWVDLLPTCLEAAGGTPPECGARERQISGRSFLEVLLGQRPRHRDLIFTTHSGDGRMNEYPMRAVRSREWKYIRNLAPNLEHHTHVDKAQSEDGQGYWSSWIRKAKTDPLAASTVRRYHKRPAEELYDLASDPWEQRNLAGGPAHAARLAKLRAELDEWMEAQGDQGLATEDARRPKPREDRDVNASSRVPATPQNAGQPSARQDAAATSKPSRPNIVVVLADDFGWGDVGCYGGQAPTPELDAMAAEGTRFMQFYAASPICSPSRAGLITGQFPARWRMTSFLQTRQGNRACGQADFLDPQAPSLPRVLKAAGYATAHIGKWHLGGGRDVDNAPKFAAYGYDVSLGTYESPEPHPDITATDWIWSPADKVPRWERTRWMVDQTLAFIDENAQRPCFVNLWLDDTHTPWVPAADQLEGRRAKAANSQANYRRVLAEMDRQIGRLLDELRSRGDHRETLVLFLGDNGPLPTFDQSRTAGLRGSKLSLYEGGIRVPLIAWWPGHVPAQRVDESTVMAAVDFFPTLCTIGGGELPDGYVADGEDLSLTLLGNAQARFKPLFWEYGRNETSFAYPRQARNRSPNLAMRDSDWKLLMSADGTGAELFDLGHDPYETNNVAAAHPDLVERLSETLLSWRRSLPDGQPVSP